MELIATIIILIVSVGLGLAGAQAMLRAVFLLMAQPTFPTPSRSALNRPDHRWLIPDRTLGAQRANEDALRDA